MIDECYYAFVQTHSISNSKSKREVNFRRGVVMMHQCRLISCNKGTALLRNVDDGGIHACVGPEGIWEIPYLPLKFSMNLKPL